MANQPSGASEIFLDTIGHPLFQIVHNGNRTNQDLSSSKDFFPDGKQLQGNSVFNRSFSR